MNSRPQDQDYGPVIRKERQFNRPVYHNDPDRFGVGDPSGPSWTVTGPSKLHDTHKANEWAILPIENIKLEH